MKNHLLKSPYGEIKNMPVERTMAQLLVAKCNEHAASGKTARITDSITGESYEYDSFDRQTRNVASALYKRGFRKGDIAIYMMFDVVKLHIFYTGVWRANGIARACYPEDDEEESRVGWIYCDVENAEMCLSVASKVYWDVEVIVTKYHKGCVSIFDLMDDDGLACPTLRVGPEDPAVIFSTSGTTGMSKGAVITHDQLIRQIYTLQGRPFDKDHVNVVVTKGTHMSGCIIPAVALIEGAEIVVMHTIRPDTFFDAICKFQPRHTFAFPAMLINLVNHPSAANYNFGCLQWCSCGGAPLTTAMERIIMQLPNMKAVYNIFGLTEVGPVLSTMDFAAEESYDSIKISGTPENAVGKLTPGVTAQFLDSENGNVLGPHQTGELCIKWDGMFLGYYNNPQSTEDSFIDGFFRTGDVGYCDEEGFVFLVDRAKEIFKYYGNHVSPTEIENVINDHPAIGEVCVVGVPDPDGGGYVPRAFCVTTNGMTCTPEEVMEFANGRLSNFKHVRGGVYFLKQLPKGKTGKVSRQLCEQIQVESL